MFQLQFTLRTQVLSTGQVFVIGVDQCNREVFRFEIGADAASNHESPMQRRNTQGTANAHGWRTIDSASLLEEASSRAPSRSSIRHSSSQSAVYKPNEMVTEFEGELEGDTIAL